MRRIVALFVLIAPTVARGDELPADIEAYLKATDREAQIPILGNDDKPRLELVYGSFGQTLDVGDLGRAIRLDVLQIIDDRTMRADVRWLAPAKYRAGMGPFWYQLNEFQHENVLVKNYPTRGLIDDSSYEVSRVFKVTGTERYETALGGTKTVFTIEPVPIERYGEKFKAAAEARVAKAAADEKEGKRLAAEAERLAAEAERKAKRDERERNKRAVEEELTRTWEDSTGKFKVTARLTAVLPGPVAQLTKEDGTVIEMKFFQLKTTDRKWIVESGKALLEKLKEFK